MNSYQSYFGKALTWYLFGFLIIWLMKFFNISWLLKKSLWLYLLGNFLLLLTLLIGTNVNGSTSWLTFGPFSLQASEFMKIALILYLYYFTEKNKLKETRYIVSTFLIVLLPSILTFLEPDTGALIPYLAIYLAFLINRNINKWWYLGALALLLIFGVSFLVLYYQFQSLFTELFGTAFFYRMDRITNFWLGEGYQINKALTSIGSSGLFGRGIRSIPEYFPEAPTDFAFALLINNLGLVGIVIFLLVYSFLLIKIIGLMNEKNKQLMLPIILILLTQFGINILMNVGLFPIIGITLPFISYGGSNLLSYLILMGLVIHHEHLLN